MLTALQTCSPSMSIVIHVHVKLARSNLHVLFLSVTMEWTQALVSATRHNKLSREVTSSRVLANRRVSWHLTIRSH